MGTGTHSLWGPGVLVLPVTNLLKWRCLRPVAWWAGSRVHDRSDGAVASSCSRTVPRMETHTTDAAVTNCGRVYRRLLRRNRVSWRKTMTANTKIRRSTVGSTQFSCDRGVRSVKGVGVRTNIVPTDKFSSREREETTAGAPLDSIRLDSIPE